MPMAAALGGADAMVEWRWVDQQSSIYGDALAFTLTPAPAPRKRLTVNSPARTLPNGPVHSCGATGRVVRLRSWRRRTAKSSGRLTVVIDTPPMRSRTPA